MSGFQGYDQWKTASPYDDFDDEHCMECGGPLKDEPAPDEDHQFDGYCSPACERGESVPSAIECTPCRGMYDVLARDLGDKPSRWSRAIYKGTPCGAWLKVTRCDAVEIGSIVEGSDAEVGPVRIDYPFTRAQFWDAVKGVNDEACQLWQEAHDE
jgi:hypothetical protein